MPRSDLSSSRLPIDDTGTDGEPQWPGFPERDGPGAVGRAILGVAIEQRFDVRDGVGERALVVPSQVHGPSMPGSDVSTGRRPRAISSTSSVAA
ncbi:hypothetical protein [Halomicrobium urmianum]|uniref:hypothetical protein n=1 Tax=Halomicrobium urmianum TaxID=1586233 RepID=UPI001CD93D1A|nr:hypothetical protein [Halomicrobium urmianum]